MFNKDNKSINKVELNNLKIHTKDDKLLTQSFAIMLSNYHDDVMMKEQMDFQDKKTTYINKKYENSIKKQYNPKIVNLYQNGILNINNDEYELFCHCSYIHIPHLACYSLNCIFLDTLI